MINAFSEHNFLVRNDRKSDNSYAWKDFQFYLFWNLKGGCFPPYPGADLEGGTGGVAPPPALFFAEIGHLTSKIRLCKISLCFWGGISPSNTPVPKGDKVLSAINLGALLKKILDLPLLPPTPMMSPMVTVPSFHSCLINGIWFWWSCDEIVLWED